MGLALAVPFPRHYFRGVRLAKNLVVHYALCNQQRQSEDKLAFKTIAEHFNIMI